MTNQPQPLTERIAEAIRHEDREHWDNDLRTGDRFGPDRTVATVLADAVLAVVQPELDERDAEIRRLTAELQQARQQTVDRIAVELATIDPLEWALAGQYGGQDAIRIARAVGTGCDCENADQPGHYIDHLTTAPRATECRGPHPVAEHSFCQLPAGHDGWHAADVGSWPSSNLPPTAAVSGA